VLVRQRPGTASGVIFTTLEDETGIANVVVWPRTFEQFRPVVLGGRFISVTGKVQSESGVIHVIADRINDLTPMLATLTAAGTELESLARADEVRRPGHDVREHPKPRGLAFRHPRHEPIGNEIAAVVEETKSVMPKGRNFH
jgi:error-prone DNA polymerase